MKIKITFLLVAFVSIVTLIVASSSTKPAAKSAASKAPFNVSTNGFDFTLTKEMIPTISGNYVHSVTIDLGHH